MSYIPVIGLEIHCELRTKSKVFCTCNAEFGGEPNSRCCPVCTGMPGTLPVINQTAVEYAVRAGYALNCDINKFSVFDRKNYFYPDLPKAYQISQLQFPFCIDGSVQIEVGGKTKNVRINRIHLEEDAGKLVHDDLNGVSLADYNRCGIPLIEIVTEPDISSAEEAKAFMEKVILLLQYADVSDCKMEQGSIRCDVNVSVMKPTDTEFGTRSEVKNLNSIKSVGRAIEFEILRQSKLIDRGGRVVQETRRFNDNHGDTKSMRSKEDAHDYRYFPDPDILQVNFTDEDLSRIKGDLPEMPQARIDRYIGEYALSDVDAKILVAQKVVSDFYDNAVKAYNNPKSIANFIIVELLRRVNLGEADINNLPFTPEEFAKLVEMADTEKVSKNDAKSVLRYMIELGKGAEETAKEKGYLIVNDMGKVNEVIDAVLSANSTAVQQYAGGETKVFGFLMGQCSKELRGVCTPKIIKETLEAKLSEASTSLTQEQTKEEAIVETEKVSSEIYVNKDSYIPQRTNGIMLVDGKSVKKEFDISDAKDNIGGTISIDACVHKVRRMGGLSFVILRTGRYLVQTVYSPDLCKDSIADVKEGCFVHVTGVVKESDKGINGIDIELSEIKLISAPDYEYPLKVSGKTLGCALDINLDMRSVSLRNPHEKAALKIQEGVVSAFREFMLDNGFTQIFSPKIVSQGAEGGANIFHLDYFDKHAYLNQSPQFYKQMGVAVFDRVFEIAPVYRAERHATSRHLNEYIGLDFEMGFIDSMYDVMNMETAMLRHVMEYLKKHYTEELELLEVEVPTIETIPTVTFLEAMEILGKSANKSDLDPEDEVLLCDYAKEKFGSEFIFVTHFPSAKRPFYAMNDREDPRTALSFDLLFRGLEITTGGQRIHDYKEIIEKMHKMGLNPSDLESYLDLHKYGVPPHGGLGIGLERLVMKICKFTNIRQASMFPRDLNRLNP